MNVECGMLKVLVLSHLFKTLLRHYAKWALEMFANVSIDRLSRDWCRAGHMTSQKVIIQQGPSSGLLCDCETSRRFVSSSTVLLLCDDEYEYDRPGAAAAAGQLHLGWAGLVVMLYGGG